ncbi:MAG: class I SAM-dependent methyltransferase [Planctomycetota bacterium]|nr:class I SAM-dependent methyltransferase [Planctomycetota bacterium]MDG2141929.1 class I SAM-dependent methyltransferase [Planctomycetota bacterium]
MTNTAHPLNLAKQGPQGTQNAHGTLEYARPHGSNLVLRGWMVDAEGPFESIVVQPTLGPAYNAVRIERPDLGQAITTLPLCEYAGFHVDVPLEQVAGGAFVELVLQGLRGGEVRAQMRVGCRLLPDDFPTPPAHLSMRVSHTELDYLLQAGGMKTACDFQRAAARHGMPAPKRILDWGCGPARVTSHLQALFPGAEIVGTDLDHETVGWAAMNYPGIEFVGGNPEPPLPFDSSSFDLITGGSVFTHLTAEMQEAWLGELRRLLVPGGRALVSTLGSFAADMRSTDVSMCERLAAAGFDDQMHDATLDGVAPEGYYRGTWQTIDWTRGKWSESMTVLEVEEAGYENYQDLWVLGR